MRVLYFTRVPPIEKGRRHAKRLCSCVKQRDDEEATGEMNKIESKKLQEKLV